MEPEKSTDRTFGLATKSRRNEVPARLADSGEQPPLIAVISPNRIDLSGLLLPFPGGRDDLIE
jgi:hypothetical protein